jgi:hypothetical protein
MENKTKFVFKVVSLGGYYQLLNDQIHILNRPNITVSEERKKWGNEYVIFDKKHESVLLNENLEKIDGVCFVGSFNMDKNRKKYIKLLKNLGMPFKNPDYFIIRFNHIGEKFDKDLDLIKADKNSFSSIFSSAFHYNEADDEYECETIMVLQHGDRVMVNGEEKIFSAKTNSLS